MLSEFESILRLPGCPVCHQAGEAERNFFSWFEMESFSTAEMRARLRDSMGMCPAHSRRLIETVKAENVVNVVAREALAGGQQLLGGRVQPEQCPICEAVAFASEHACGVLLRGLIEPASERLYREHEGICLVHLLQTASSAEASTLRVLADHVIETLSEADADSTLRLLAGCDDDSRLRARWRERLPDEPTGSSSAELLTARLEVESCPVCLSAHSAERHYLQWFVERAAEGDPSLRSDSGEFCRTHLHDVAFPDAAAADLAIERKRSTRAREVRALRDQLAELPATARRGRRARSDDPEGALAELLSGHYCPVCHAVEGIERSQFELLAASLALTPVRERYERSHGLCVRHSMWIGPAQPAELVKRHLGARLSVLAWEVQETARKYAFAYRHEMNGPEQNAWRRALVQIDGGVLQGGPAAVTAEE